MDFQQLLNMILKGESSTLEFKKSSANLKNIAETLCAFLNRKGGTVLIGVSDKGNIIGQHITDQTRQEIAGILRKFEPSTNIETQYIPYQDGKQVIMLSAHPDSYAVPYTFDGKAFERNESTTSPMSQGRYQQLLVSKNLRPVSWESQPAIRESLINAICHREYASPSGSITLTIYDDRLEIANTGRLPADITLADLRTTHISHPRNPRITNVFFRRGFIESMGIGTQEIIRSCALARMKEPDFYEQGGAFVIRLWSRHYRAPSMITEQLTDRQRKILTLLKNSALSPQEILINLKEKISDRTLRRDLQNLKEVGYVESEGQGKKLKWFLKPGHNLDITWT